MSRRQERDHKKAVRDVHRRVRAAVGRYLVENETVLCAYWVPLLAVLGVRAARHGPTAQGFDAVNDAMEALVAKAFWRGSAGSDLQPVGNGLTARCVTFPALVLDNGDTVTAAFQVEETRITGKQCQRWRRLHVSAKPEQGRARKRRRVQGAAAAASGGAAVATSVSGGAPATIPAHATRDWGGRGLAAGAELELRAVDRRPAIDPLTRKANDAVTGASGDPAAYLRLLRAATPRDKLLALLNEKRHLDTAWNGLQASAAESAAAATMRAAAAARQRKSRENRTHAASTTRSLLAASGTGSVRAKARLKDHLTAYCSALEGAGAESAEDQRDILLALLVENIRLAPGTPDVVAQELIGLRC
jgi:hypothetical protein